MLWLYSYGFISEGTFGIIMESKVICVVETSHVGPFCLFQTLFLCKYREVPSANSISVIYKIIKNTNKEEKEAELQGQGLSKRTCR